MHATIISRTHAALLALLCGLTPLGCDPHDHNDEAEAGSEAGSEASSEASTDASSEASTDATMDTGSETGSDDEQDDEPQDPMTIEIRENEPNLTMINAWTPKDGVSVDEVAAALTDGLSADIRELPGFVVAGVHASQDESNVLVYGHWTDQDSLAAAQTAIGEGQAPTFAAAFGLADSAAHPYRVASVITSSGASSMTIAEDSSMLTMVNTWTPKEGASVDEVAAALIDGINAEISTLPGFMGASVLASLDESNVRVYGHWEDQAALDGVQTAAQNGEIPLFSQVFALADSLAHPYAVRSVIAAP
ncbi:MAG: antibiotic biosynthesis monooxygenase [Myxococcota bacterium]